MENFTLLAPPWWVNLLLLVPLVAYFVFSRKRPQLTSRELLTSAVFALSFGFVEGAVAIYLGPRLAFCPDMLARSPISRDYPRISISRPSRSAICRPAC